MEKAGRKWGYLKGYVRVKSEKRKGLVNVNRHSRVNVI